jgi:hypothetical protein
MRMNRRVSLSSERGASAVLVAILLLVIMGITALAVDAGGLYQQRRRMVRGSDAGALAIAQWCVQRLSGTQSGSVTSYGDTTAADQANVPAATRSTITTTDQAKQPLPPWPSDWQTGVQFGNPDATPSNPSGSNTECNGDLDHGAVWVKYGVPEGQAFAPVLGFGASRDVHALAKAAWGAAGGAAQVAPLMLSSGRLNNCNFTYPFTNLTKDVSTCAFFWDNGANNPTVLGNAEWGTVDLHTWGPPYLAYDSACPGNASLNDITTWLGGGYPGSLFLKDPPPTYVCKGVGSFGGALDNAIRANIGKILPFPVNDPQQQIGKANGNYFNPCTPAMVQASTCTVDKYAMIAFASLKLNALYTYQGQQQAQALAACGTPPEPLNQAANARCLVTTWEGLIADGILGGGTPDPTFGNTYGTSLSG